MSEDYPRATFQNGVPGAGKSVFMDFFTDVSASCDVPILLVFLGLTVRCVVICRQSLGGQTPT